MADPNDKGAFQADIPTDAVQEALRSVERISRGEAAPAPDAAAATEAEVQVEPEVEEGDVAALRAQVTSLEAQLDLSQKLSRDAQAKLKDEHDRVLRAAADLENYRKRAAREREDVQKFGSEKLLKDLFPVVDNLDRALASAPPGDPLADGVKLVRANLEQALAKHGVSAFSAMGEKFDPAFHEALLQVPTRDAPPGTVVLEHARGFKLHDRLVRPAMVGVAVDPPPDAGAGNPG